MPQLRLVKKRIGCETCNGSINIPSSTISASAEDNGNCATTNTQITYQHFFATTLMPAEAYSIKDSITPLFFVVNSIIALILPKIYDFPKLRCLLVD